MFIFMREIYGFEDFIPVILILVIVVMLIIFYHRVQPSGIGALGSEGFGSAGFRGVRVTGR